MAALWTFLRGLFAIFLGAILFFQPDKGLPLLTTFMGGFWIGSGLLSVRWGMGKEHSKLLTIVVGAIGIHGGRNSDWQPVYHPLGQRSDTECCPGDGHDHHRHFSYFGTDVG